MKQKIGFFLEENNAKPGFKFKHPSFSGEVELLCIGKESAFCRLENGAETCFHFDDFVVVGEKTSGKVYLHIYKGEGATPTFGFSSLCWDAFKYYKENVIHVKTKVIEDFEY